MSVRLEGVKANSPKWIHCLQVLERLAFELSEQLFKSRIHAYQVPLCLFEVESQLARYHPAWVLRRIRQIKDW